MLSRQNIADVDFFLLNIIVFCCANSLSSYVLVQLAGSRLDTDLGAPSMVHRHVECSQHIHSAMLPTNIIW